MNIYSINNNADNNKNNNDAGKHKIRFIPEVVGSFLHMTMLCDKGSHASMIINNNFNKTIIISI